MKKLITDLTPQELNSFLMERYGFNLFPFAGFLLGVVRFTYFRKKKEDLDIILCLKQPTGAHILDTYFGDGSTWHYEDGKVVRFEANEVRLLDRAGNIIAKIKKEEMVPGEEYVLTTKKENRIKRLDKEYDLVVRKEEMGVKALDREYDLNKLKSLKKKLLNLKKNIIETMIDVEVYIDGDTKNKELYDQDSYNKFEKRFAYEYDLESFFDIIFMDLDCIDQELESKKPGSPINKRNLLASMWALHTREINQKIDWILISDLIDWFWKKLSPQKIYKGLRPVEIPSDPEYYKNQFYKHAKRWAIHYKRYREGLWISKKTIIIFGKKESETSYLNPSIISAYKKGVAIRPSDSFTSLAERLYNENPIFNWIVIFPDYSYLLT